MISKVNEAVFKFVENVIVILLFGLTSVAFLQLTSRYLLRYSNAGIDELIRLAFVWVVATGSAITFRKKSHVGITFFANTLKGKKRILLDIIVNIILSALMITIIKAGIGMTQMGATQISTYLGISIAYFYSCIPTGAFLSLLVFVEELTKLIKQFLLEANQEEGV
jgi:TRAP-type C4-dicarboxylate transport system permease small subunit